MFRRAWVRVFDRRRWVSRSRSRPAAPAACPFLRRRTPGGGEDRGDLQSLFERVQESEVQTVAVLGGRVTHGAAELALQQGEVQGFGHLRRDVGLQLEDAPDTEIRRAEAFLAHHAVIEPRRQPIEHVASVCGSSVPRYPPRL